MARSIAAVFIGTFAALALFSTLLYSGCEYMEYKHRQSRTHQER